MHRLDFLFQMRTDLFSPKKIKRFIFWQENERAAKTKGIRGRCGIEDRFWSQA
jgi:hypothetical protein